MGLLGKFLALTVSDTKASTEISKSFAIADCASCANCSSSDLPASERYPTSLSIDNETPLWGSIKPWSLQILCATGKTDWIHNIFDEKSSVAHALDDSQNHWSSGLTDPATGKKPSARIVISNSSLPPPDEYFEYDDDTNDPKDKPTRVLILPEFVYIENITPNSASADIKPVIDALGKARASLIETKLPPSSRPIAFPPLPKDTLDAITLPSGHKVHPATDLACIVLCSHRTRDKRCAVTSNILKKKFESELKDHDLYRDAADDRPGGVPIHFVSHVGGHKFAANVIIYTKSGQAIWLARVRPEHVTNIINYCILKGEVFPDMLRSAFNTNPIAW
ncbi:uncharacterized protein SAPINGB_P003417 [Magnusiomyces paraingens]|uniref:Actin patches distal protein 1 n=1 Tax=Magnusiomyces paraingens TaxID=2606893 RepID=A0A5E8BUQ1_9ASCO|nr:uncharacterized protein SAPINGB_P003417 [Saprochaete ingens]VVT53127.1 unnamed protein product [Saprochaete ingens]